ncbi:MAG: hemolysin family protein [Lachnospiraceae bacterium]|nr:hemolysin family protein [Lachnospiraceae bacterium]
MDSGDATRLLILIVLLGLSAFFSSSETALTAVNKIRIKTLANDGDKRAVTVEKLLDDQPRMISALLIGNNIVNTGLTALATVTVSELFGNIYVGLATGVLTILILIFGEITPKNCAAIYAEDVSLKVGGIVYSWMRIVTPVSIVLNSIVKIIMRIAGMDSEWKDTYTENEIRTIVDESHEDGEIETEEREMINNVFDLGVSMARDVMVPRVDMVFLNVDSSYEEILNVYREHMYTRLPVYEGDTDNVIGLFNIKDLLLRDEKKAFSVRDILREAYFTHEYKKTSELMQEMLKNCISLAIVLDEYGDTVGLVTIEDLLEEIVGDIRDEYDEEEENSIVEIKPGEYIVDGSANLDDISDRIPDFDITSEEYDSIGGVIIGLLDRLPDDGDEVITPDGIRLKVISVDHNHIDKVHIFMPKEDPEVHKEDKE